jgi:hypothetical protein
VPYFLSRFFETTTLCKPYKTGNFTFDVLDVGDQEDSDIGEDITGYECNHRI